MTDVLREIYRVVMIIGFHAIVLASVLSSIGFIVYVMFSVIKRAWDDFKEAWNE